MHPGQKLSVNLNILDGYVMFGLLGTHLGLVLLYLKMGAMPMMQ